jgi:hypothetical protein
MANEYVRGQQVRLTGQPLDINGTPADPSTVAVTVTDPVGTSTIYTYAGAQVVKDSAGNYHYDLTTAGVTDAQLGYWIYAWVTTGTPAAAEKNTFRLLNEKTR